MVKYENQCCDCTAGGYPCVGKDCHHRNVKIYVCDCCHDEVDELFEYDTEGYEEQLCANCLLGRFKIVE